MKDNLIKYGQYLLIIIATYVLVTWFMPIFISCLLVLILQPLLDKEINFFKMKNSFLIKCLIVFNYLIFISGIMAVLIFIVVQIYTVLELLPNYIENIYILFSQNNYIIDATEYIDILYSGSISIIEKVSSIFITTVFSLIVKIPSILFDLIFVVIASLFILLDYPKINQMMIRRYEIMALIVNTVKEVLSNMFKAYFIIMLVTFIELLIGFNIVGLNHSIMFACIIAVFDFFPILGLDMIMIPWIIITALINDIALSGALLVIYMIVVITKNILEPKLLAKRLGIMPFFSLISMYIGMKIMGMMGIVIMPTLLVVMMQIYKVKQKLSINK